MTPITINRAGRPQPSVPVTEWSLPYRLSDGTPYGNGYSFPQAFGIFPGTPFKHMKISECALRSDAEETA